MRQFAETTAKQVAARHALYENARMSFDDVLRALRSRSLLQREIAGLFYHLKSAGNLAAHEDKGTASEALTGLKVAGGTTADRSARDRQSAFHAQYRPKCAASRIELPFPDETERLERIRRLESVVARADRLEAEAAPARKLLDRLESAILAKTFRGELVPQDPDDEPVSVLLERIRAVRVGAPKAKRRRRASV